ncbi:hypothetical protein ACJ73_05548 [Blastomyces percursus]|uniref:F-box domain-containing protein n=1 Tax=Blastomyces percursus TaxID=1658174 RepID=A0A1J9Q3H0_9EURO|nr:hypothetical protein ACJ73_05548 [Blastomyces percursus]
MAAARRHHYHDLPLEVVEEVAENLDLEPLKCLRLTSRKTTHLTESSSNTIMAVIYDASGVECILTRGVRRRVVGRTIGFSGQKCDDQDRVDAESDFIWLRTRQRGQNEQSDESTLVPAFLTFARLDSVNIDAITVWGRGNVVSTLHGKDSQVYRLSISALATSGVSMKVETGASKIAVTAKSSSKAVRGREGAFHWDRLEPSDREAIQRLISQV